MKDNGVRRNPATLGGAYHDAPRCNRTVKRLRSHQRRLVVRRLTLEAIDNYIEADLSCDDFELVDKLLSHDEREEKTLTERAFELAFELAQETGFGLDVEGFEYALGRANAFVCVVAKKSNRISSL